MPVPGGISRVTRNILIPFDLHYTVLVLKRLAMLDRLE